MEKMLEGGGAAIEKIVEDKQKKKGFLQLKHENDTTKEKIHD